MNDITAGPPLGILAPNTAPIECVPAVTNFDFLPDMGRMTARLPSADAIGRSPAPTRAASRAAAMYTLIESAKLNGIDPRAWLARLPSHPASRIHELPWHWQKPEPISAAA